MNESELMKKRKKERRKKKKNKKNFTVFIVEEPGDGIVLTTCFSVVFCMAGGLFFRRGIYNQVRGIFPFSL